MLNSLKKSKKIIYLDYAATTPVSPEVQAAMAPFWHTQFGNPSSLYSIGDESKRAINNARNTIAKILGADSKEIIFTSGGTESINLAVFGVVRGYLLKRAEALHSADMPMPHIITSTIEHHAVLKSFEALEREGIEVTYVPVDESGFVKVGDIEAAIKPNTILVSIMYANNEIGTIEPIAEIGKMIRKVNASRAQPIIFHTDACQAGSALDMNVQHLHVDLLSVNASKMYGPKQVGLLYVRKGIAIEPLIYGGGQEHGLRSGTENVPGIVGFGKAFEMAQEIREDEDKRLYDLRNYLYSEIIREIPDVVLNGPALDSGSENQFTRLPNNLNVSIPDVEGEALMLYLNGFGICVSTGSACTSTDADPSHVILALGRQEALALGAMRFSLGKETEKKDLGYVVQTLSKIVAELRRAAKADKT